MLWIPRSLAHRLRALFKRTFGARVSHDLWLRLSATATGLTVRAATYDVALEYRVVDRFPPAEFAVKLDALQDCASPSDDPVSFSAIPMARCSWPGKIRVFPGNKCANRRRKALPEFPAAGHRIGDE